MAKVVVVVASAVDGAEVFELGIGRLWFLERQDEFEIDRYAELMEACYC